MKVTVCRPGELGPDEVERWHHFQEDPDFANPFLSPAFARAADAVRDDARVAVAHDGGVAVGFLPFSAGRAGVARPIAAGFNDRQAFVHAPDLPWRWPELLRGAGLRALRFDHLCRRQVASATDAGARAVTDGSFLIDLSGGWEQYRGWAKEHRGRYLNWLERKQRRLVSDLPEVTFSFDDGDGALPALMALKSAQCLRMGWHDAFSGGWTRQLVERLAQSRDPGCAGTMSVLRTAGRVVAADFSLRHGSVYVGWLIAYDDELRQRSPGAVRWWYLLRAAADAGITTVDLGRGGDDFKRRFSTDEEEVGVGWLAASPAAARLGRAAASGFDRARPAVEPRARRLVRRVRRVRTRS
jgi:CelD/BcsL family acetyltransferase involved in cellulose biosynthesis